MRLISAQIILSTTNFNSCALCLNWNINMLVERIKTNGKKFIHLLLAYPYTTTTTNGCNCYRAHAARPQRSALLFKHTSCSIANKFYVQVRSCVSSATYYFISLLLLLWNIKMHKKPNLVMNWHSLVQTFWGFWVISMITN